MREQLNRYFGTLTDLLRDAEVADRSSKKLHLDAGYAWVLNAARDAHDASNKTARTPDCKGATFSGVTEEKEVWRTGDVNFYVRSREYGFVQVAHLACAMPSLTSTWVGGGRPKIGHGLAETRTDRKQDG